MDNKINDEDVRHSVIWQWINKLASYSQPTFASCISLGNIVHLQLPPFAGFAINECHLPIKKRRKQHPLSADDYWHVDSYLPFHFFSPGPCVPLSWITWLRGFFGTPCPQTSSVKVQSDAGPKQPKADNCTSSPFQKRKFPLTSFSKQMPNARQDTSVTCPKPLSWTTRRFLSCSRFLKKPWLTERHRAGENAGRAPI